MRLDAALRTRTSVEESVLSESVGPASSPPLVSLQGVWRHWGRRRNRWAVLRDINLEVAAGTAISIGGGNGAGKTTLLRIATGILSPDSGSVTIEGISAEENWREYHRRIGFLSAGDRGLYARLTVRGHLDYWASLAIMARADRKLAVEEAITGFGLSELADRRADRLSQGQRQRLRLALTMLHQPKVLFLDEPRNSLDAEGLELLTVAVGKLLAGGGSVMWCSPLGEDQPMTFDRALLIEGGELRPA
jgi:ABC-type multidrug transport system ATPase subunit